MRLRVVTWNLHSCVGTDGRLDPARVGDVLEPLGADVIGLQEVDGRHPRVAGRDQLGYLAHRLGMHVVAGPNLRDRRGEYGNGLLTRRPPTHHQKIDLSIPGREPRGAIEASFRDGARPLRLLVTHLGLGRSERRRQLATLRERVVASGGDEAVVLIGDLNEWRPLRLADRGLSPDPFPTRTRLRTFPSRYPLLPLDRILVRPQPKSFEARIVANRLARSASDHLPLVADLAWADAETRHRKAMQASLAR